MMNEDMIKSMKDQIANAKSAIQPRGTDSAKIVYLIKTKSLCGGGQSGNPVRQIEQYWDFEGKLLFTEDPYLRSI